MKKMDEILGVMTNDELINHELINHEAAVSWPAKLGLPLGLTKLTKPATQPDLRFVSSKGQWVLSMDSRGVLTLNPDVPQSEAVKEFVELCNSFRGIKG